MTESSHRLDEMENAARASLSEAAYHYYAGGAEDEVTLRAYRRADLVRVAMRRKDCWMEGNAGLRRRAYQVAAV